jgi:hypothetical protein
MNSDIEFYPMATLPEPDESDTSFSKTVIIYGESRDFIELGYYDFEAGDWIHFGKNIFLLKYWCYIPDAETAITREWEVFRPKGFKSPYF